ncbi:MAG: ATP-binding protein [Bacteroidales bacterium]|jgi:signal transduction histidine kinase
MHEPEIHGKMNKDRRTFFLLITFTACIILAVISDLLYFSNFEYSLKTRRFNSILKDKERTMENCLNSLKIILARGELHGSVLENSVFLTAGKNDITILEYLDNKLNFWSDNDFDVPRELIDSVFSKPIIFMQNGWFLPKMVRAGNETIVGLLRVRTEYGFENDIIKNGFQKDFRMSADVRLSTGKNASEYKVYNNEGIYLFSLLFPKVKSNSSFIIIPLVLWIAVFMLIILLALRLTDYMAKMGKPIEGIISCFLIFIAFYLLILFSGKPAVIFKTGLFSPYNFSLNRFIPTEGHLVIISILFFAGACFFFRHFPERIRAGENKPNGTAAAILTAAAGAVLMCIFHSLFSHLVSDSNINFETYKVLKLSFFSVAGFISLILLFLIPPLILMKAFRTIPNPGRGLLISSAVISVCIAGAFLYGDLWSLLVVSAIYCGGILIVWVAVKRGIRRFPMTVLFSLMFGLYSLFLISVFTEKKTNENLKVKAFSLSMENDPEAENLLLDMWPVLRSDAVLNNMMNAEVFGQSDFDKISNYLHDTYFDGYWGNFNINITLCGKNEPLMVGQSGNNSVGCFDFFNERIRKYGHQLTGTGFYFIDNQGGRSYYLGMLEFKIGSKTTNGLFMELYGDVDVFQPGYSELLLDKKFRGYSGLKDYSFARYINGDMVLKSGDFAYDKADDEYIDKVSDYRVFSSGGFRHVLYKNGNSTEIISRPGLTAGNIIISFAYLFAFIFILINLFLLLIRRPSGKGMFSLNFRQKLQLSFMAILFISFLLVGIVVAILSISQFRAKHYENIKETLNSVYIELDNRLSAEKHLSAGKSDTNASLNEILINLSNIFNTDINLYDLNGFLIATSRPQIFYRDLAAQRIDNTAFNNLAHIKKSEYLQTEQIGEMKYISEYVPFYNADNNILAYLNIPYFRMQSLLAREISNLVVAVANFTLLLILITMSLAIFISGRLTAPLSMLSSGLASVRLGKKSEHLSYKGTDEIGELVGQYNKMVDELEDSAQKLADSEREYAWREMAKQIAHEIKNPLTPMKLNVQQLLKSWKDKATGFEEKIEGFSKSQIEYIDNLSSIASAFSSFAKMPGIRPMEVNLPEQVKTTLELFKNTENVSFRVNWPRESKIFIYADKENINGIFSNLFKNSIQAIPPGRKGEITVGFKVAGDKVTVSVSDNGNGIPESLRNRMFTPNFTTKSSGTGLGLSIARKYVEVAGGEIWFESEAGKGSTFYVRFPLVYTVEKPDEPPAY